MLKRVLIVILSFVSTQNFAQWKSFYPENNKKDKKISNSEKDNLLFTANFFLALKSKSLEDYSEALNFFQICIKENKDIPAPYYESSLINKNLGNNNLAVEQIKKAVDLDPNNRWYIILYAEILFSIQDFKNSAIQYEKIIALEPGNEELYFMLADTYIYNTEFQKAINIYNDLEKYRGIDKSISIQKQKLYMQLNKKNEAIKEMVLLLEVFPNEVDVLEVLSDLYILNNQKDKAVNIFNKISRIDPNNGRIHLTLADYYRSEGDNEKSYQELLLAFKASRLDIDTKIRILVSYYQLISINSEMRNQAYQLAKVLIEMYPDEVKPYVVYADILYADGNFQEAKEQYLKILDKDKTKIEVWTQVLFIQAEQSDFSGMKKISKEALTYFPLDPLFYYFNGISNKWFKNYKIAILSLNTGIEFIVENEKLLLEFYSSLGDAYHATAQYSLSDSCYEKALYIEPENIIVLNNYAYYLSLRKSNLIRAKEMSLKCNNLEPENGTYQDTYAWILYQMKEFKEAKKWILEALKNGSNKSPVVVEHYGDILYQLGNLEEAIIQWRKAKDLGKGSKFLNKKIKEKKIYE